MDAQVQPGGEPPGVEPAVEPSAVETEPPGRVSLGRLETPGKKLMAVIAGLTAIVTLSAGSLELKDRIFPPGTAVDATVTPTGEVGADVTWRKALSDNPELGSGSYTPAELETNGALFTVKLNVKGESGKTGHLEWRLLSDAVELELPSWVPRSIPVSPSTDEHEVAQRVWSPLPRGVVEFTPEFTYVDSGGTARDTASGPPVRLG
jgi:hypothetical protein